MKKKIIIFFSCLLILILGYVCYKSFLLFNYKVEIKDELQTYLKKSTETITIEQSSYNESNNYSEYEDVMYKKLENDFLYSEKDSIINGIYHLYVYSLTNENTNKLDAVFKVGKTDSYYELLAADNATNSSFKNINKKALLNKYNLNNDFDLLKYLVNNHDKNPSIFSSRDDIELNYLVKTFANIVIPNANIIFITGDLSGFMYIINNDVYEIHLTNNKYNYVFGFFNKNNSNYFNLNYVKDFINNIQFKK